MTDEEYEEMFGYSPGDYTAVVGLVGDGHPQSKRIATALADARRRGRDSLREQLARVTGERDELRAQVEAVRAKLDVMCAFKTGPEPLKAFGFDMTQYLRGQSDMNKIWFESIGKALNTKAKP